MKQALLPIFIVFFFFNYHFFSFYDKGYSRVIKRFTQRRDKFESVYSQHPYYEIYKLAKLTKNGKNKVFYLMTKPDDQFFDYSSTYFLNKNKNKPN